MGKKNLTPDSKALSMLKNILSEVGKESLYYKIVNASSLKQRLDTTVEAFKTLSKRIPKENVSAVRQLYELVAQVDNLELKSQLEAVLIELFEGENKSLKRVPGLPFYQTDNAQTMPKKFDFSTLSKRVKRMIGLK